MDNVETHYADWRGFTYFLELAELRHPSGDAVAWSVRYWVMNGDEEAVGPRKISDEGTATYDKAREVGERHAKAAIDKLLDQT